MPDESEVPPRIWISYVEGESLSPYWSTEKGFDDAVPYVPASALSGVWDEAIAAIPEVGSTYPDEIEEFISAPGYREDVVRALEAARDAALSAGKESNDEPS